MFTKAKSSNMYILIFSNADELNSKLFIKFSTHVEHTPRDYQRTIQVHYIFVPDSIL